MPESSRRIRCTDGVELAVYESGPAGAPTIVAVHGFPDDHTVWDRVLPRLAGQFRVVTYDVRGAGASDRPRPVAAYRLSQLVEDLAAVVDAASPDAPVHLVGHDWGSIQSWPAVTDERLATRIATFTSISGPSLDYAARWLRGRSPAALRQLVHSYYVGIFQLPMVPEFVIRRGWLDRLIEDDAPRTQADEINGLQLYRANVLGRLRRPRPVPVGLPVQLIVPERDSAVTPAFAIESARPWVADLAVHRVPAGHWVPREQPGVVADLIRAFAG